ncbi:MAG: UDP-glucose 4-epimerase [Syntrophus sp. (in: bacteria)]|nr:UDP-glucose 4-epimerase [Syntrophus sp. (in: bacteria)]
MVSFVFKILVTGGAGFIGSRVAQAYLQAGHQVVVLDNLARGRCEHLPVGAAFYNVDICDRSAIHEVIKRERPNIISHHAALVFVRESQRFPENYLRVNLDGTRNVMKAAREAGADKFIFASSGGAVYGDPPGLPLREDAPRLPRSPYGETKMWAEDVLLAEEGGLEVVILRYGNVYGPGQDHSVVTRFAAALRDNVPAVIFGDGSQSRDYVYVTDVVRANLLALKPGLTGIFNIGSAEGRSVLEVYRSVAANMHNGVSPLHLPDNAFEVRRNVLDIRRARSILGWQPEVGFEEGVRLTVEEVVGG